MWAFLFLLSNLQVISSVPITSSYLPFGNGLQPKASNLASAVFQSIVKWAPDASNGDAKSAANNLASDVSQSIVKWAPDASNGDAKSAANNLASDVSQSIVKWAPDAPNGGPKSAAAEILPQSRPAHDPLLHKNGVEDENQTTSTERFSSLGIFHGFEDFSPNNTILLGGYWGNVDPTGNLNCPLESVSICQAKSAVKEHRQCFRYQDQDNILNYSSQLLNTNDIKLVKPDTKMYALPFPNPFNVTVVRATPLVGCQNNPVTCHPMNSDGCLVYVCHVLYSTKAFQITVKSDEINDNVNMIAICHYETAQFLPTHAAFRLLHKHPGDIVCHFVGVTNYLMCTNDK